MVQGAPAQAIRAWSRLLLSTLSKTTLMVAAALVFWAALPALWAWQPTTVASDSMAPGIRKGDVVVAMPVDPSQVRQGQVLLVNDPDVAGRMRLHRMVGVTEDGLLSLRGDANQTEDSSSVSPEQVRGVGVMRIPFAGLPGLWIGTGDVVPLVALGLGAAALIGAARLDRTARPTRPSGRGRLLAGGATASMLVLTLGVGPVGATPGVFSPTQFASAAFSKTTANTANSFAAQEAYECLHKASADSPFFYYRFSERSTSATTLDDSGEGRHGTILSGAARFAGSCVPGDSPYFKTQNLGGYVSTPTLVGSPAAFSFELWFRVQGSSPGGLLLGFGDRQTGASTNLSRALYLTDAGNIVFGVNPGVIRSISSPASYIDYTWHHVVATLAPTTSVLTLYVDGQVVATSPVNDQGMPVTDGYWRIAYDTLAGWPSRPGSDSLRGQLDNTAVYTSALGGNRVSAHFAAGRD